MLLPAWASTGPPGSHSSRGPQQIRAEVHSKLEFGAGNVAVHSSTIEEQSQPPQQSRTTGSNSTWCSLRLRASNVATHCRPKQPTDRLEKLFWKTNNYCSILIWNCVTMEYMIFINIVDFSHSTNTLCSADWFIQFDCLQSTKIHLRINLKSNERRKFIMQQ